MAEQAPQEVVFNLEKIFVRDISYESPRAPHVFMEQGAPAVNVQLAIDHEALNGADGAYGVMLSVTVDAKVQDKSLFLVEVHQGGVFRIHGLAGEALERALEIACPHVLLPFAREAVNELVTRGGFPSLLINPVNFEALYEHKRGATQAQA